MLLLLCVGDLISCYYYVMDYVVVALGERARLSGFAAAQ